MQEAAREVPAEAAASPASSSGPHDPDYVAALSPAAQVATDPFLGLPGSPVPTLPAPFSYPYPPANSRMAMGTPSAADCPSRGNIKTPEQTAQPLHPFQPMPRPVAQPSRMSADAPPPAGDVPAGVAHEPPKPSVASPQASDAAVIRAEDGQPWQPSQMQGLAAAALATARSASIRSGSQGGTDAPSVHAAQHAASDEPLQLSQELLDKPRACGGSTMLGAAEEEAALAALQGSREAGQHSAAEQAADAAQRAACAIRAHQEAEVQAMLEMFTAEDFASPQMRGDSSSDGGDVVGDDGDGPALAANTPTAHDGMPNPLYTQACGSS